MKTGEPMYIKNNGSWSQIKEAINNTLYGATAIPKTSYIKRRIFEAWTEFRRNLAERIYCERGGKG